MERRSGRSKGYKPQWQRTQPAYVSQSSDRKMLPPLKRRRVNCSPIQRALLRRPEPRQPTSTNVPQSLSRAQEVSCQGSDALETVSGRRASSGSSCGSVAPQAPRRATVHRSVANRRSARASLRGSVTHSLKRPAPPRLTAGRLRLKLAGLTGTPFRTAKNVMAARAADRPERAYGTRQGSDNNDSRNPFFTVGTSKDVVRITSRL